MSKKQYIHTLNQEIQKLNGVIDLKIVHGSDYKLEARRHKRLLAQIRREEARRSLARLRYALRPSWLR